MSRRTLHLDIWGGGEAFSLPFRVISALLKIEHSVHDAVKVLR